MTPAREEAPAAPPEPLPAPAPPTATIASLEEAPAVPTVEAHAVPPAASVETPRRTFEELVVPADAVIGLQMEGPVSSERARVEDRIVARVSRDVRVGSTVAIPSGARALGNVVVVERGGRLRERASVGIRFHTIELSDGSRLTISTDTIFRYGEAPGNGSAAKIGGGAVAGAILGAIINGGKGAAIGAATGAGAGTAAVMTGDRSAAVFPAGSDVTARILSPVTVSIERE
jgi:type IV secretory pathway VirB10-like protein